LNRAVAVAKVEGAARALQELERVKDIPAFATYHLFHATCGEFYGELNDFVNATISIDKAIQFAKLPAEKELLKNRLGEMKKERFQMSRFQVADCLRPVINT